jgi:hypothetical protein
VRVGRNVQGMAATISGALCFDLTPAPTSMDVATTEPTRFAAGSTVRWLRADTDFPAPTWVLKYALLPRSGETGRVDIVATAQGTSHLAHLTATQTTNIAPGEYTLIGFVESGEDRYKISQFDVIVEANPLSTPSLDSRSFAERAILALEESLMGCLRAEWASMSIGGKTLSRMSLPEKLAARDRFKAEIARIKAGSRSGIKTIPIIFS